jgi:glucuronokinase
MILKNEAYARAGLLGNPSDMYGGKVISFVIKNFAARVRLWESQSLTFRLHPQHDRTEFADLQDLVGAVRSHGYYGMQRLLLATCRRFADFCQEREIKLRKANFTLEYESDIPRQSGLGGSSAIIIAALRALLKFYRVPAPALIDNELADLALSVEMQELGITAGLQDRVVQVYGGLTYMDFSQQPAFHERLDSRLLPRFGLAYLADEQFGTRESGQVHNQVRYRWERGDPEVKKTMRALARLAAAGLSALKRQDHTELGRLMNRNFDLRRALFGDKVIGRHSIRLIELARARGFPAKLPGSGGAALVLLNHTNPQAEQSLAKAYAAEGYHYTTIHAV